MKTSLKPRFNGKVDGPEKQKKRQMPSPQLCVSLVGGLGCTAGGEADGGFKG